jgi:hypothetical protein
VEPDLDRAALAAALQRDYGLAASAVRFVPVGETAWCYQVTDEQGGRWFLKLGRPGAIEPARAEFALELGRALAELGLPVPRPQPTRGGALWCWLGGLRLALFEFVDGAPLSDRDLSAAGLTERVAGLAAAIHGATGALAVPVPFAEMFEVWTDGLRSCLAELEAGAGGAERVGLPRRGRWCGRNTGPPRQQQRVQALGDAVRSRPRELVLCHGDLRGDNLLVTAPAGCGWWTGTGPCWHPANATWSCSPAEGSRRSWPATSAPPTVVSTPTRTCSPSSCCAATSRTWSTGSPACSPAIDPWSSGGPTWMGCGGACRAGRRWRPASSTPAGCWHGGGGNPARDADPRRCLVVGSAIARLSHAGHQRGHG